MSPSSVLSEVLSDDGVVVLDEGRVAEDVEVVHLADEVCASGDEEDYVVDQKMSVLDDVECVSIPPIGKGGNRDKLVLQTKEDKSLVTWRKLGGASEKVFKWKNELLYLTVPDNVFQTVDVLVLPREFRCQVLKAAHDGAGHLGHRKELQLVWRRFAWPLMTKDIVNFCNACIVCQKCSRAAVRKAPMVERPVLSEPFEQMAFDLVDPLPKAKGGYRYVLTAVCMATKWPEAIPLRSITAKAVAEGMLCIFSRMALPLEILTDQGSQFVGKLMRELCLLLGIGRLRTTAYHPQTNGMVERMHSTLEGMLTKAHQQGMDWALQNPFALFARRQLPNRDTLLSPFELVFGRNVRTPLELIHIEWTGEWAQPLDVCSWVEQVAERVELARETVRQRMTVAVGSRKAVYDRKASVREFSSGSLVLSRLPGLDHKLDEAWSGPWEVVERLNKVNYRIKKVDGTGRARVVHINTLKACVKREEPVRRLTVVTELGDEEPGGKVRLKNKCKEFKEEDIERWKSEFGDVLVDTPGNTDSCIIGIEVSVFVWTIEGLMQ